MPAVVFVFVQVLQLGQAKPFTLVQLVRKCHSATMLLKEEISMLTADAGQPR